MDDDKSSNASVTLEEIADVMEQDEQEGKEGEEDKAAGKAAADLFNQRLDGEAVPENFRGKSVSEMIQYGIAMDRALRISEESRQALVRVAERQPVNALVQQIQQEEPLTKERLAAMMQEDPVGTVALMIDKGLLRGMEHVNRRLEPMANSGIAAAERHARETHKLEFDLFGDQIKQFVDGLTDKSGLQNPAAWDDIISYVRGRSDNLPKYIHAVTAKPSGKETARESQRASAGFTPSATQRGASTAAQGTDDGMDDTERQIAQSFIDSGTFKNMAEYNKWKRIGQ